MKFGKSLSNQIEETLPEWRDKFLSYKELKKQLKSIDPKYFGDERPVKRPKLDEDEDEDDEGKEIDFTELLDAELDKFNAFFVEQEEDYIIRLKELQDRVVKAKESSEELMKVLRKEIVDFHGEMVLLENYSALNYTGLVKILKKYEKRTGAVIRLPFIQRVLQQPFFTTDLIYKLVKECEIMLDGLNNSLVSSEVVDEEEVCDSKVTTSDTNELLRAPKELAEIENMESLYMKSTVSALRGLKEIRNGSSTVSVFSLPPMQSSVLE
ncbi:hypothetical protein GIB67_017796 [Kingdonia uniflora]|uniref:SPX domain-containing protein n=1 Tax=Kingdonia uniflora TaxID=39325 RepID=A0A7J7MPE4_9MAGN|nr:hypothetical protein GIB67_017796 [Kingdonia uniflora]